MRECTFDPNSHKHKGKRTFKKFYDNQKEFESKKNESLLESQKE
jgi:hypothetical protein